MGSRALVVAGAVLVCSILAPDARAQILPRIPPAPSPVQEYVPPPPPKPVEAKPPPQPEAEIKSLLVRDAAGQLKEYSTSLEEAVVRATVFPADRQRLVDQALAAREAEFERWAADNVTKIKTAFDSQKDLDNLKDFNQLFRAKEAANALQQENLLDRLVRDGAITVLLRTRIDRVVNEYNEAQRTDWQKQTGDDIMKIAAAVGRQSFRDQTREVFAAFDRLIKKTAPSLKADIPAIAPPVTPEQTAKLESAGNDPVKVRECVLEVLKPDQARTLLTKHAPPPAK